MSLETATYIDGLVATNPTATDPKSQGDDHLRLIKATLKATFPAVAGPINASHIEINHCDGVTSPIQSQINSKGNIAGQVWSGAHNFAAATAVTVPTKGPEDNSTNAASTAYVQACLSAYAPIYSPALTGTPTAPTPALNDASTQIATTAFAAQLAFQAVLPAQPGGTGTYVLSSTAGVAGWSRGTPDYLLMAQGVI